MLDMRVWSPAAVGRIPKLTVDLVNLVWRYSERMYHDVAEEGQLHGQLKVVRALPGS